MTAGTQGFLAKITWKNNKGCFEMVKTHVKTPKKSNGLNRSAPPFPREGFVLSQPTPRHYFIAETTAAGRWNLLFLDGKRCGLPLDGTGYKKKSDKNPCFRFNWVNRKITPKWLVYGMVYWVYNIIWFYLRCNELAMKSVFIEYSISFPSDFS